MGYIFAMLQRVGKAIMLPIAVLPAAALILRLGAPDVFDIPFIAAAGKAIFDNLPLIFATGIAMGLAKNEAGAAALSGVVGYLVLDAGVKTINPDCNMGVFAGLITGISAGVLYNKYSEIKLPECLGFFAGSRFVPIVTCLCSIIFAVIFGNIWGFFNNIIVSASDWIIDKGALGVFVFGVLNRALLPIGMHHILDSILWFFCLEYITENGVIATGDLSRFFAGDPTAGIFMAGFFPIMMFALPAIALAIYHTAYKENRKQMGTMLLSLAFTSFFTGITEPIEYLFMFVAPILYVIHAILTGLSMAVTYELGVLHGFGFSAGFIDYVLNYGLATKPILIIPIGLVFAVLYYIIFRIAIVKFDLKTPGRLTLTPVVENKNSNVETLATNDDAIANTNATANVSVNENTILATKILEFLGGEDNIKDLTNCVTRLRVEVNNPNSVDVESIKKLQKIKGVISKGAAVQVIIGPEVERIAGEIKKIRKQE